MNKGDTPPRSIQDEEEYLQEEADIKEVDFNTIPLLDRDSALLSLLVYIVATSIIDHFTDHFEALKQVTIITKDPDAIICDIKEELNKTCTIINSSGVIAGENKTLICYVNYFELQKVKEIISRNKGSFSTVSTIDEILR